ncbi:aspartyl/asparaginyl beta-hydroxylase domain-containing protein [Pseudomonas sp. LT1P18]|uniref:aspartyl/asparaginyl beta-hydroxylase domain-containing protein n=1 Tax=Pseudomonas arabinosi TaxID=3398357 RepID=UPI0039EFD9C1
MASKIIGKINISAYDLASDVKYLNSVTKQSEEYDEFGQGYWKNLSVYNASGDASDTQYRNTDKCFPTEHAKQCPGIQDLVSQHFKLDNLKMIRARSLVDGLVIPHRDFVELDQATTYFRVFVALENNDEAFHSDERGVFQMMAGEVWFLDAGISHAAVNFGLKSRMFLCLDFMYEGEFEYTDIFAAPSSLAPYRNSFHIKREPFSDINKKEVIAATSKILNRFTFKDIIFTLSKYHFIYDLPVSSCYDWIISAAEQANNGEIIKKAKSLRRYLIEKRDMGERYTINDWNV